MRYVYIIADDAQDVVDQLIGYKRDCGSSILTKFKSEAIAIEGWFVIYDSN
jgi:hypothetical protein